MNAPLLPYFTDISQDPFNDPITGGYRYQKNFLSSETDVDEDLMPTPTKTPVRKRGFEVYSSDDDRLWHPIFGANAASRKRKNNSVATVQKAVDRAVDEGKELIFLEDKGITELPPSIKDLNQVVKVGSFNAGIIESGASMKPDLQIYLKNNQLTDLPEELYDITNLTLLSLRSNSLTSISPSIGKLVNLRYLNTALNPIPFYPASILKLQNLQSFIFSEVGPRDQAKPFPSAPMTPPSSASKSKVSHRLRSSSLTTYSTAASKVPRLLELCQRIIAQSSITKEEFTSWSMNYDLRDDMWDEISRARACDGCGKVMVNPVAVREEIWDGFANTRNLPIRRYLCNLSCLELAPGS